MHGTYAVRAPATGSTYRTTYRTVAPQVAGAGRPRGARGAQPGGEQDHDDPRRRFRRPLLAQDPQVRLGLDKG